MGVSNSFLQISAIIGLQGKTKVEFKIGEISCSSYFIDESPSIKEHDPNSQNGKFQLITSLTDCLAKDQCGIPKEKKPQQEANCCYPNSGCC